jgi:hypothetical protein
MSKQCGAVAGFTVIELCIPMLVLVRDDGGEVNVGSNGQVETACDWSRCIPGSSVTTVFDQNLKFQAPILLITRQYGETTRLIACSATSGACKYCKCRLRTIQAAGREPGVYVAPT